MLFKNLKSLSYLLIGILIGSLLPIQSLIADTNIKLIVNGKEIINDVPPQIIAGRTMVPARALCEALNAEVSWDEINNSVIITSKKQGNVVTPPVNTNNNVIITPENINNVQRIKWNDMDAIIKDGQTYFLLTDYSDKINSTKNNSEAILINNESKIITIKLNGKENNFEQSINGWIIFEGLSYINSKHYIEP